MDWRDDRWARENARLGREIKYFADVLYLCGRLRGGLCVGMYTSFWSLCRSGVTLSEV